MAYTPELCQRSSGTLRRIAWALGVPMTIALEKIFEQTVMTVDKSKICKACRDKSKCNLCDFKKEN